jgi:murein L,D-transpeptidase YcbB/YkuD
MNRVGLILLIWVMMPGVLNAQVDVSGILSATLHQPEAVRKFYESRNHTSAWDDRYNAQSLIQVIGDAVSEGLNPESYHYSRLLCLSEIPFTVTTVNTERELLLTDAFFTYALHQLHGQVRPEKLYPGTWKQSLRNRNLEADLTTALQTKTITETLHRYRPAYSEYNQLMKQLMRYGERNTIQLSIPASDSVIVPGVTGDVVVHLRRRLSYRGYVPGEPISDSALYDSALTRLVQVFQRRHGLEPDGIIGKKTLHALSMRDEDYTRIILINLERYRWMPDPEERMVVVNIPEFYLRVFDQGNEVMKMKVIDGRPERVTPVLDSRIRYLIVNPTWTVPRTILREDVLPAVKQNIGYLRQHRLRVINGAGQEIDPDSLPWSRYTDRNFPYQLRQDPGQFNSLGVLKFHFSNEFNVFLHDTNAPFLFRHHDRALSSGCVRVEHPLALATWLMKGTHWTQHRLMRKISSGSTETILLPEAIPVHLVYFTAGVDSEGNLVIRNDVYELDEVLWQALTR